MPKKILSVVATVLLMNTAVAAPKNYIMNGTITTGDLTDSLEDTSGEFLSEVGNSVTTLVSFDFDTANSTGTNTTTDGVTVYEYLGNNYLGRTFLNEATPVIVNRNFSEWSMEDDLDLTGLNVYGDVLSGTYDLLELRISQQNARAGVDETESRIQLVGPSNWFQPGQDPDFSEILYIWGVITESTTAGAPDGDIGLAHIEVSLFEQINQLSSLNNEKSVPVAPIWAFFLALGLFGMTWRLKAKI